MKDMHAISNYMFRSGLCGKELFNIVFAQPLKKTNLKLETAIRLNRVILKLDVIENYNFN